jgi:hypothetical protein
MLGFHHASKIPSIPSKNVKTKRQTEFKHDPKIDPPLDFD